MIEPHWTAYAGVWFGMAAVLVAAASVAVSYLVLRSAVDPCVIVYATPDLRRSSMIVLVIENIGRSPAKDITFEFSAPIPAKAWGFLPDAPTPGRMEDGPLISGVPALGPGARRVITWGQFGGLHKALDGNSIVVTARYRSDRFSLLPQKEHETVSALEVISMWGTDASTSPEESAASSLKKIASSLDRLSGPFKTLRVRLEKPPEAHDSEGEDEAGQ